MCRVSCHVSRVVFLITPAWLWRSVRLSATYAKMPVVFVGIPTQHDAGYIVARVTNVTKSGFMVKLQTPVKCSSSHSNHSHELVPRWAGHHTHSRVNCVPSTFQPRRDPSAGWWSHFAGAGGTSQYQDLC